MIALQFSATNVFFLNFLNKTNVSKRRKINRFLQKKKKEIIKPQISALSFPKMDNSPRG